MNNRNTRRTTRGRRAAVQEVPVTDQLAAIREKFTQLRALNTQIGQNISLYRERSQLLEELLPAFVTVTPTQFIIEREITIGNEVFRLNPYWFDTRTNAIKGKVFKASAFETFVIE